MKKLTAMVLILSLALSAISFPALAVDKPADFDMLQRADGSVDMKSLMNHNSYEALSGRYATIGAALTLYDAKGNILSNYFCSIDNENHVYYHNFLTDIQRYLSDGLLYVADSKNTTSPLYVRVFLTDAQRDDYTEWYKDDRYFFYDEKEKLLYSETEGDMLVVTTENVLTDDELEYFTSKGFEGAAGYKYVYYVNPETNIIEKSKSYIVMGGGEALYCEYSFYSGTDEIAEPDYAAELKKSGTRTLTVHVDDKTLTFTVYKGHAVKLVPPEGCGIYKTPDGRANDAAGFDFNADIEVYLLPDKNI